eukprot:scaffold27868_cov56-Phaeocystis_antarctica.AAC.1
MPTLCRALAGGAQAAAARSRAAALDAGGVRGGAAGGHSAVLFPHDPDTNVQCTEMMRVAALESAVDACADDSA